MLFSPFGFGGFGRLQRKGVALRWWDA